MKQYIPLASKSFSTDEATGLEKKILATRIFIDPIEQRVEIGFEIVLFAPNGVMVSVLESSRYTRDNSGNNPKYDQLYASDLGKGIMGMIQIDFNGIASYATKNDDLLQLVLPNPIP